MRLSLRPAVLFSSLLFTNLIYAQSADRFAYAVTDIQKEGGSWNYLRRLDLKTGKFSEVLLNGNDLKQIAYDATTKKVLTDFPLEAQNKFGTQPAFSSGVAAMAYDRKNNRIWYTPMFIDQLRYVDLKTMKVFYVTDNNLTGMPTKNNDQSNIVTRMVIAYDGYGYALTNDANNLIRFNTKKNTITNLGPLADAPSNSTTSVHNSCSSYGGDMIADDEGNLLIISARNTVFKVDIETKVATFLGSIKGLPQNFTSNGAVVDDRNRILLSSAVNGDSWAILDLSSMTATAYKANGDMWRSSDLANSNILQTRNRPAPSRELFTQATPADDNNSHVMVYPNPVNDYRFTVQFNQLKAGAYTMILNDVTGRQVMSRSIIISGVEHAENVNLNSNSAHGVYLIKLTSQQDSKLVYTKKIVVQ